MGTVVLEKRQNREKYIDKRTDGRMDDGPQVIRKAQVSLKKRYTCICTCKHKDDIKKHIPGVFFSRILTNFHSCSPGIPRWNRSSVHFASDFHRKRLNRDRL